MFGVADEVVVDEDVLGMVLGSGPFLISFAIYRALKTLNGYSRIKYSFLFSTRIDKQEPFAHVFADQLFRRLKHHTLAFFYSNRYFLLNKMTHYF